MLKLHPRSPSHEELFLSRYAELISWSMQITRNDRDKAEDIVHDAYLQWILVRPDLASIRNLDGYLYGMLRNMHSAELRRAVRASGTSLSVVEYDSAFLSLQQARDESQISYMQGQLRQVCDYACARKETSKAGSLLLLRFFHGYYPGEVARLAGIRRVTVDSWLRIARNEARTYLQNSEALKFIGPERKTWQPFPHSGLELDFLDELSERIFQSGRGRCLSEKQLRAVHADPQAEPLSCEDLAHISSCRSCLTKATKILNLSPKDDRDPGDRLGRDPKPGEKSKKKQLGPRALRIQLEDVIEHRPKELHIAVNGFTVGTQKVISEGIEHSLKVSLLEQIGLVEVLSEQGIRLLCLYVEPPPAGPIEQSAQVYLSDDRTLGVNLNFQDQWPSLDLTYSDPHFSEVTSDPETILAPDGVSQNETAPVSQDESLSLMKLFAVFKALLVKRPLWSRPSPVALVLIAVLSVAIFIFFQPATAPLPAEILSRARSAEKSLIPTNQVSHRRLSFEERSSGGSIRHRNLEVWQTSKGMRARRLFDDKGGLVAGAWKDATTASQNVFYHHGSKFKVSPPESSVGDSEQLASLDHVWLLDPSAATFAALVAGMNSEQLRTSDNQYVLTYRENSPAGSHSGTRSMPPLTRATLVLDRSTLHALSEVLVFGRGEDQKEFTFTELSFETVPAGTVDQKVFQPDVELLAPIESTAPANRPATSVTKPAPTPVMHLPNAVQLAALEVNVLYLLDQINANSGEEVQVRRFAGKELVVEAIIESEKRKTEILRALSALSDNPLVKMDVVTLGEAIRRQSNAPHSPESIEWIVISSDRILVYDDVRRYLEHENARFRSGGNSSSGDIEDEIRRFSVRMLGASRQALLHAFALKHLTQRFSPTDLAALDDDSRRRLQDMIRIHARVFRQNVAALRGDLAPIFPHTEADDLDFVTDLRHYTSVLEAIKSLLALANSADETISRAFALNPDSQPVADTPASADFWRTLSRAENLAAALERIQ
jgi:RNA polymerase sigma factor (sigma-70 family)